MTDDSLAGRKALVTGAARGIGAATAALLAQRGAEVVVADIDGAEAEATAAMLHSEGLAVQAQACDVTREDDIALLVDSLGGRLDILVNNAAILDATPIGSLTRSRFETVQQINQNAALWVTLTMRPLLAASAQARVVNVASIQGLRGAVDTVAYSTAKGGVVNMTRALATDLAPEGILVNCVCPGFVDTRMALLPDGSGHEHETDWFRDIYIRYGRIPLRRAAPPEDIARAIAFFCGDDCRYVTGQILTVDGGLSATF